MVNPRAARQAARKAQRLAANFAVMHHEAIFMHTSSEASSSQLFAGAFPRMVQRRRAVVSATRRMTGQTGRDQAKRRPREGRLRVLIEVRAAVPD